VAESKPVCERMRTSVCAFAWLAVRLLVYKKSGNADCVFGTMGRLNMVCCIIGSNEPHEQWSQYIAGTLLMFLDIIVLIIIIIVILTCSCWIGC
jgi:hypothetical protein